MMRKVGQEMELMRKDYRGREADRTMPILKLKKARRDGSWYQITPGCGSVFHPCKNSDGRKGGSSRIRDASFRFVCSQR